nr:hypothetical protein [uncultured bacterium]
MAALRPELSPSLGNIHEVPSSLEKNSLRMSPDPGATQIGIALLYENESLRKSLSALDRAQFRYGID